MQKYHIKKILTHENVKNQR